jgi:hypothetical protein
LPITICALPASTMAFYSLKNSHLLLAAIDQVTDKDRLSVRVSVSAGSPVRLIPEIAQ